MRSAPPPCHEALDLEDLRERVGGDEELLLELLGDFLQHVADMGKVQAAAEAHAFAETDRLAHRVKGSLLALGAKPAACAAAEVEHQAAALAAGTASPDATSLAALSLAVAAMSERFAEASSAMRAVLDRAKAMTPSESS